ncbi:MAG: hypothetical protein WBY94_29930 [Polyangiaceae bacterium]
MSPPVRWRDDESVPSERRELLRRASGSRALPKEVRTRSAARIRRLLVVPAAAGLFLWMKSVAAAGLCVLGVVAAVHVVPALTHWVAPAPKPAPVAPIPVRHRSVPTGEGTPRADNAEVHAESSPPIPAPVHAEAPTAPAPAPPPVVTNHAVPGPGEGAHSDLVPVDSLAREAAMLEQARAALDRNPSVALAIANRHAATFPAGSLGVERELVAVQALQRLGRYAEARTRGSGLLEQARGSIYEKRVKTMLETMASP